MTLATAMAALGVVHVASAATFDGVGTHSLRSTNLAFSTSILGGSGSSCTTSDFAVNVPAGGATATVTAATFDGCIGTGAAAGLVGHVTATHFPWEITRAAAGTFDIDAIHLVFNFTGAGILTFEGSLEGSIHNATHVVTLVNSEGLFVTSTLGNSAATMNGTFTDNLNTLAVT